MKKIAADNELHFICGDKGLRENAASIKNILTYTSFDGFFKSAEFDPAKKYYDSHGQTELKRLEFLALVPGISASIRAKIESWGWFDYYVDYPYCNDEFVTITSLYDISATISNDDVKFIAGEFYVEVNISGKASLEYFVDKSVALWMEEKRMALSDCNDYVFQAEEEDVAITIRHTLIIPEEYLHEDTDIDFTPDDVQDEIQFNHINKTAVVNKKS